MPHKRNAFGVVVVVYVTGTEDRGFESLQGIGFLGA
jgi:hypothetical protein